MSIGCPKVHRHMQPRLTKESGSVQAYSPIGRLSVFALYLVSHKNLRTIHHCQNFTARDSDHAYSVQVVKVICNSIISE